MDGIINILSLVNPYQWSKQMGGGRKGKKTKKKKTYTKAQQMAKKRISEGKTISSVKAANKKSMQDKARERHTKFTQTKVQTFGGKKTSFSNAEKNRIKAAGYSVEGYSKAPAQSNTQLQVNKDNQMYGNTVPTGSFNISDEAKAQAEANKKAAQEEATRKSTFDSNRALNYAKGLNLFNTANIMAPGGNLGSWYNTGSDPTKSFKQVMGDEISMSQRTKGVGKGAWNPFRGMPGYGSVKNVLSGKPFNTKFEGGFETGPTEANRRVFNNLTKVGIGTALFNQGRTGSLTDQVVSNTPNVNVGGLSIGFKSDPSTDVGARVGSFFTSLPGKISDAFTGGDDTKVASAGGLNIGGGVDSGEAEGSGTGRTVVTTDKDKNISYDIGGIAKDVGLGIADAATLNKFDFDNLGRPGDDKTFTQKFETFKKSPLQQAIISTQTGIDAKRLINEGESAAKSLFSNYIGDIDASSKKGVRQPIAKFLKDVGSDDATAMAGRAIDAFKKDDESFSNDPNALTKALEFTGLPQLSEENVQDIRHTFNKSVTEPTGIEGKSILKNVPYNQAFGLANRIVSGKLSDATGEAMNQLGMGNVGGIDDAVNLGMQINTNKQAKGTVANKRFGELNNLIQKYGPGQGQIPTIPSIIKGIGGAVGTRGGSGSPMRIQGGGNMTATFPTNQQVAQEVLPLPTTATQTGTDSGNLAGIMQNAYANQMSLYGMNPNYFANIMQPRFNRPRKRFRQVFNRGYF